MEQQNGAAHIFLCFALVVTGLFPWLLVNAIYSQLPRFISTLPEGPHIATRIIISVSIGNLFMVIFVLVTKNLSEKKLNDLNAVTTVLLSSLSIVLGSLLGNGWKYTAERAFSYGILLFSLLSGAVGSISNVTIWPFAACFGPKAVLYLGIGTALSAAPPTLMALVQRPGEKNQLFSSSIYFYCQVPLLVVALAGVIYANMVYHQSWCNNGEAPARERLLLRLVDEEENDVSADLQLSQRMVSQKDSTCRWGSYVLQAAISSMYYFLLGMLEAITRRIGSPATTLLYATVAHIIGGAAGRLLSILSPRHKPGTLATFQCIVFAIIIMIGETANHSGILLRNSSMEKLSFVAISCLCGAHGLLFGYISNVLFGKAATSNYRKASKYMGFAEQTGATLSSILAFVLVQYTTIM